MHEASFEKMRAFRNTYLTPRGRPIRVLDVGSGSNPGTISYRDLFATSDFEYVGLDIAAGHNVDLVPDDPFSWSGIAAGSFDLVISGQAFEHNPYFWITAAEIARVLVPNGLTAVIAPSAGRVHRFPHDCWRFYPDSWAAISAYVGLELVESFTEQPSPDRPIGGSRQWLDAMMIARKPEVCGADFYGRLEAIVATRPTTKLAEPQAGPAAQAYMDAHTLPHPLTTRLEQTFVRHAPHWLAPLRRRFVAHLRHQSDRRGDAALPWPPAGSPDAPEVAGQQAARLWDAADKGVRLGKD
jgi:SAM-dependent methyltransferase